MKGAYLGNEGSLRMLGGVVSSVVSRTPFLLRAGASVCSSLEALTRVTNQKSWIKFKSLPVKG